MGCRLPSPARSSSRSTWRRAIVPRAVDAPLVQAGARVVHEVRARRREDRPLPRRGARLDLLQQAEHGRPADAGPGRVVPARPGRACSRWSPPTSWRPLDAAFKQAQRAVLRRRRVVVAVPAAHEPARGRAARPEPAHQERLDAAGRRRPTREPPWRWRDPDLGDVRRRHRAGRRRLPDRASAGPARSRSTSTSASRRKPPGGYKIFVHFDGPAAPRVIGDHDPLNHAFGTSFWLPGEYIRDHYETDVPLMTTPAGTYTVYMGFWPGGEGKRLKVTQGPNDGDDRVRLGTSRSSRLRATMTSTRQRQAAAGGDGPGRSAPQRRGPARPHARRRSTSRSTTRAPTTSCSRTSPTSARWGSSSAPTCPNRRARG